MQDAVEQFYRDGGVTSKPGDAKALEKVFAKYQSKEEDGSLSNSMFEDDLMRFFDDIKVPEEGLGMLVVAWKLKCKMPAEITKEEFTKGFAALGCSNLSDIATAVAKVG